MSTIESNCISLNSKSSSNTINFATTAQWPSNLQSQTPPPPPLPLSLSSSLPSSPASLNEDKPNEKLYKKEKQILFEFDQIVKGVYSSFCPSIIVMIGNECKAISKFERTRYIHVFLSLYTYIRRMLYKYVLATVHKM